MKKWMHPSFDPGPPAWRRPDAGLPTFDLPDVELPDASLGATIGRRISTRRYGGDPPTSVDDLSVLLHGAYGVLGEIEVWGKTQKERPVPSGGAKYPLEVYVLARRVEPLKSGIWGFDPELRRLVHLSREVSWDVVTGLFLGQSWLADADAIVVLTAIPARTLLRYGERGVRFIWMEAGHVAQNLQLLATARGLGVLSLGGFQDQALASTLGLDPMRELPLYGIAVGRPEIYDRVEARIPRDGV